MRKDKTSIAIIVILVLFLAVSLLPVLFYS